MAGASDTTDLYEVIVTEVVASTHAAAGSLVLLEEGGEWIRVAHATGYAPAVIERFGRFQADADLPLAEAIRTARPVVLDDVSMSDRYEQLREAAAVSGLSSTVSIPLPIGGRVIGAIGLSFEQPDSAQATEHDEWTDLGDRCAQGLARMLVPDEPEHLAEMLDAARGRLAFVSAAGRDLARSLDHDEVITTLTRLVVPRFADWSSVLLPDGDDLVAATLVHRDQPDDATEDLAGRFRFPIDAPTPSSLVYRRGEPLEVMGVDDEVRARMDAYPELAPLLETTTSRYIVPMVVGDRVLGLLTLASCGDSRLDSDDRTVMAELASRAGTALEHAQRFDAERTTVETLQRAMLPQDLPVAPALELAARYLPAAVGTLVGGDWFDAFALDGDRFGLCIGDVAGHGVEAAACMAQLRNALRAYALDEADPAVVLTRLNRFAIEVAGSDFCTVLYAVIDLPGGLVTWTSAGHLPILQESAGSTMWHEGRHGVPIGVHGDERYTSSSFEWSAGERLVLYTDGLVERRTEAIDAGLDRLANAATTSTAGDLESFADDLLAVAPDPRADDVCLLAARRCDTGQ